MHEIYHAPKGFNFDWNSKDEPIHDNPHLEYFNIEKRANEFVEYFRNVSLHYKTEHVVHTFGGDF